jgi:NAD+ kinase
VPALPFRRLALVVHPTRDIDSALDTLRAWAADRGVDVVQARVPSGAPREVAELDEAAEGDLVVALGGDGTVLKALRASAGPRAPVLGVACGSLGALSAITADELAGGLERLERDDWVRRAVPALSVEAPGVPEDWAINDFVVLRGGAGQLAVDVRVDDELYVRLAGDGVIVATALGSSAYSMAAGGPILAGGAKAFLCTPLAMHGGSAPPVVVPEGATLQLDVHPGWGGWVAEVDGDRRAPTGECFRFTLHGDRVELVAFTGADRGLTALRERGVLTDSPRILARDAREK